MAGGLWCCAAKRGGLAGWLTLSSLARWPAAAHTEAAVGRLTDSALFRPPEPPREAGGTQTSGQVEG